MVFRDDSLRTWSVQLNLAKEDEAAKGDDDDPPKETKKDKKDKDSKKKAASKKDKEDPKQAPRFFSYSQASRSSCTL